MKTVCMPGVERAGAEQRVRRDQVVEPVAPHGAQRVGGERRLELEDAGGAALRAAARTPWDRRTSSASMSTSTPVRAAIISTASWITVSVLRPSMSILSMPTFSSAPISYCVMMDSSPSAAAPAPLVGARADRHVLRQRARRDHHAGRVHRHVARDPLDPRAQVQQPAVGRVALHQVPELVHLPLRLGDREAVGRARRDQLGDPVGLARRNPEHAGHVLDRRPRLHRPEGDDLAHARPAVALADVLDHLAPALEAEVDVDVGHRHALGIEEALEQQVELERADVGDAERVGDDRARRRAAARAHRNAALARGGDEVLDDEEVAGVARRVDDAELVVEPLLDRRAGAACRSAAPRPGGRGRSSSASSVA